MWIRKSSRTRKKLNAGERRSIWRPYTLPSFAKYFSQVITFISIRSSVVLNYISQPFTYLCLITNITEFLLGAHSWRQSLVRFASATYIHELLAVVSSFVLFNRTTNNHQWPRSPDLAPLPTPCPHTYTLDSLGTNTLTDLGPVSSTFSLAFNFSLSQIYFIAFAQVSLSPDWLLFFLCKF